MAKTTQTIDQAKASSLTTVCELLERQSDKLSAVIVLLDAYDGDDARAMRNVHVGLLPIIDEVNNAVVDAYEALTAMEVPDVH